MARIIPKDTKINATIWKGLTIWDFVVVGVYLLFVALVIFSDIPYQGFIVIFSVVIAAPLFAPMDGGGRLYNNLAAVIQFRFAKKEFAGAEVKKFVPYTSIRETGIIAYPEYFSKIISVGQIEFSLLEEHTQDNKIAIFERVIKLIDEGSSLDIVKIDRPLNLDAFSASLFERVEKADDPVKRDILRARIEQIDRLNNIEKQYRPFFYLVFYNNSEKNLIETVQLATATLEQCEIGGDELNAKETVNFLKYCHTRFFDEREIDDVPPEKYIDYIVPKKLKFTGRGYKVDDVNAFTFALSDYPLAVKNAWGADIFNIDNTKVVLKVRPIDKFKAIKRIDKVVNELGSREENIKKASEVISNESHVQTMTATLQSLQNENEALFDCTLTVTAFNNDNGDLPAFRRALRHSLSNGGFKLSPLSSQQIQGFLASNISQVRTLKRYERGINSSSLAAVFPFVTTSIIDEPNGIILGLNKYPVALDISKRDGDHTNGNCLILGKPGSGKSYIAKTLISNLYADDWRVYIFDVENEFSTLAASVGGAKIDVGAATQGRINPFHIYGLLTDDGKTATTESVFNNHLIALESFLKITLDGLTSDTLEYINNLIVETYRSRGITDKTDCSALSPGAFPIFDDLMSLIREKLADKSETANPLNLQNLQRAETYISKFADGGRYSSLWNGASSLQSNRQFTVFNFQSLLANKNQIVANAQMLLVMRFLEQEIINTRDKNRDREKLVRTAIVADEAHAFTDPKFPIALDFLFQMAKRIRKYAGALFFITQNLGDGTANQEVASKTQAIFANCQYSFIFQLPPQDIQRLVTLYEKSGGINDAEQDEITNNRQGTCFLISATRERASFSIVATPTVEKLFIRNDEKQL
jgi:cyclophilin family peptidyl-prolyl cis-trans isomerase